MRGSCQSPLRLSAALVGLLCAAVFPPGAHCEEPKLSISGYDPVAYFTDGKPVQGKSEIEYLWHRLRWRFASGEHRDPFVKDPDRYTPQYDGYCAMGVSNDSEAHKDIVDPEAWAIVDGKLYLTHNQYWLGVWQEHSEEYIKRANASWQALADRAGTCRRRASLPGFPADNQGCVTRWRHWVVVGGQIARDEAGNVVGKGNLQQQIEQIGKNVGVCLEAGGATVKDIVFTVSYVKQPAEFDKYADLRQRYFGPPSPDSTVVPMPQSTNPDLLVQVEAFAKIP